MPARVSSLIYAVLLPHCLAMRRADCAAAIEAKVVGSMGTAGSLRVCVGRVRRCVASNRAFASSAQVIMVARHAPNAAGVVASGVSCRACVGSVGPLGQAGEHPGPFGEVVHVSKTPWTGGSVCGGTLPNVRNTAISLIRLRGPRTSIAAAQHFGRQTSQLLDLIDHAQVTPVTTPSTSN